MNDQDATHVAARDADGDRAARQRIEATRRDVLEHHASMAEARPDVEGDAGGDQRGPHDRRVQTRFERSTARERDLAKEEGKASDDGSFGGERNSRIDGFAACCSHEIKLRALAGAVATPAGEQRGVELAAPFVDEARSIAACCGDAQAPAPGTSARVGESIVFEPREERGEPRGETNRFNTSRAFA